MTVSRSEGVVNFLCAAPNKMTKHFRVVLITVQIVSDMNYFLMQLGKMRVLFYFLFFSFCSHGRSIHREHRQKLPRTCGA